MADDAAGEQVSSNGSSGRVRRGVIERVLRLVASLFRVHAALARKEAAKERDRIIGAVLLFGLAACLALAAMVLLHVTAIVYVREAYRLRLRHVLLGSAAADLLLAVVLLRFGARRLRAPVMQETRETLRKTVASLSSAS